MRLEATNGMHGQQRAGQPFNFCPALSDILRSNSRSFTHSVLLTTVNASTDGLSYSLILPHASHHGPFACNHFVVGLSFLRFPFSFPNGSIPQSLVGLVFSCPLGFSGARHRLRPFQFRVYRRYIALTLQSQRSQVSKVSGLKGLNMVFIIQCFASKVVGYVTFTVVSIQVSKVIQFSPHLNIVFPSSI
jgi:hypothetical protein